MRLTWVRQCLGLSLKHTSNETTATEKNTSQDHLHSDNAQESPVFTPDSKQEQLLLHGPKQEFTLVKDGSIPQLQNEREMLIKVTVLGLNPIDWKGPYVSFTWRNLHPAVFSKLILAVQGIQLWTSEPALYIGSRLCRNRVETTCNHVSNKGRRLRRYRSSNVLTESDLQYQVFGASTDYRDYRKSAFQQYVVASDFNVSRIPSTISPEKCAALGVAFVSAVVSLGICLGVNFESVKKAPGPDLLRLLRKLDPEAIPDDVRSECLHGMRLEERPKRGDWIAIWGGM